MGQGSASRGVDRALAELDRDRDRVAAQISSFLTKLDRDPISATNLRFSESAGFTADSFEFKGKTYSHPRPAIYTTYPYGSRLTYSRMREESN